MKRRVQVYTWTVALALLLTYGSQPAQAINVTAATVGVTVSTDLCPGNATATSGCFDIATRTIYWTDRDPRTFEHELAHAWEHDHLTDPLRAFLAHRYRRLLGRGAWFQPPHPCEVDPTELCPTASPGERFAQAWAYCRYPVHDGDSYEIMYGYNPGAHGQLRRRLCNTILLLQIAR